MSSEMEAKLAWNKTMKPRQQKQAWLFWASKALVDSEFRVSRSAVAGSPESGAGSSKLAVDEHTDVDRRRRAFARIPNPVCGMVVDMLLLKQWQ